MNEMIKLYDLFGTEIRSRSNTDVLREKILDCNISIIDLSQITFISRSFADELCNLSESDNIKIYNAKGIVKNMLSIVSESRKNKRIRRTDNAEMKEFSDFKSLSNFLATIS